MNLFLNAEQSEGMWVYRDNAERLVLSWSLGKASVQSPDGLGRTGEVITGRAMRP